MSVVWVCYLMSVRQYFSACVEREGERERERESERERVKEREFTC